MQDQFYFLDIVDSTNIYAANLLAANPKSFTTIVARYQIAGRGQQQNKWESNDGENLLMSTIFKPNQLHTTNLYSLYMASSLAVCALLDNHLNTKSVIKWPNDILVDGSKIAGILIENSIRGTLVQDCIVGVGLNVNQHHFSTYNIPAASMHTIGGSNYDIKEIAYKLLQSIKKYLGLLDEGDFENLRKEYLAKLYGFQTLIPFRKNKMIFNGKIIDISETGGLIVSVDDDDMHSQISFFQPKEIEFVFD
ncbi:MAG: biotin--[acetyl-CoA-carboxylase] ligase [Bacteroidetes bacterium]|nr:biotin--[acetyl-CoA-carboxylase] ligase [Bacteroidota bacterium]